MGNSETRICLSCSKEMQTGAAFCTNCGTRYEEKQRTADGPGVKRCSSCGKDIQPGAVFCANCGTRYEASASGGTGAGLPVGTQLLSLNNDFLSVQQVTPVRFEFSSRTGASSPALKVKIQYDAIAQLDSNKREVTFWEKMVETGSGMKSGFFGEKTVQRGTEVTREVHGHILFGGKYGFEYGKLREVVKAIAAGQGWKFKLAIFKPKG